MIDLIVSQGRVADRAPRMIAGAALIARALEERYGLTGRWVGEPAPATADDWRDALPQARRTLTGLATAVGDSLDRGHLPVMIANTCSTGLATLPVAARAHPGATFFYIDAHGDFNTPDTGYLGGMVLSGACGLWDSGHGSGVPPRQAVLAGTRDIDDAERALLAEAGVRVIPPAEVSADGVRAAAGDSGVWIHLDWDVMEPGTVPADYTVPDGLRPEQIRAVFTAFAGRIRGVEVAEFNAPDDPELASRAVALVLDMIAPVFETAH